MATADVVTLLASAVANLLLLWWVSWERRGRKRAERSHLHLLERLRTKVKTPGRRT